MKAYRVLDPRTRHVRLARDVIFNKSRGWDWTTTSDAGAPPRSDFAIKYHVEQTTGYPMPGSEGGDTTISYLNGGTGECCTAISCYTDTC
ncbi:hypothetical protein E2562_001210 [Oryza meyeriana var. granulata]|uniref:Retroviral polymerase SH3-like domain-containing protein n=1 Tax=Oryza meyeriana var. granulata TaxID=110450 RepID=A0A6G1DBX2_9ORYZ|nr:hypothetical protein E2562_001210 [Oryza meyeriana var. granulata]